MVRRRKGLQHMISTQDHLLTKCYPPNLSWENYMEDCEKAVNTSELHSDEWSTNDEELANKERKKNERSERLAETNSVIKIHEKKWRSSRVCKVLKLIKNTVYYLLYIITINMNFIRLEKFYIKRRKLGLVSEQV